MMNKILKRFTATTTAILTVFALMGAANAQTIELGYVLWDSEIASTNVVAYVIQEELGYDVNMTSVDAAPMWLGVAQGDFDAIVAAWLPFTHASYWEQFSDDVVDLGPNLEGAVLGWVVPAYVPVESITELNDYVDEFGGQVIGIDPGAGLMQASEDVIDVYDLDYTLVAGSDAAMIAELDTAIANEEWTVVTGWIPHWKFAAYDLRILEDPELALGEEETINTILSNSFYENGPEDVVAFLDNFFWNAEQMGEVMLMINEEGMDEWEAAATWVENNRDIVNSWLE